MPATVSHVLSATTPDDPAFEIRPSHWNSSHQATYNMVGSEISSAFGNGGGVTFGYDGTNVTAVAPAGAPSPVNFSAGTTSNNLASVVFSNSGGISFGLNGSTITGTVATNYQSQGAYLTTAMQSNAATISNVNISAGSTSTNASAFTFSNANGLSFQLGTGANVGVITGSYTVPTVTNSSWTVSDTATSATVGRLAFTAANGITMTLSTSNNGNHTLFASYTVPTVTSWTVSDTVTSATVGRLAFTAANGLTLTLSTSNNGNHTVFGSYTVPTVTSWTVSDNATSATVGRLAFTNANGVTMTLSTSNNGNHTVFASHNGITSQSTQFLAMTLAGNTAGTTTFNASNNATLFFNGGNNITLSGNGSTVTISAASQTVQTQPVSLFATSNTTNSTSVTAAANSLLFQGAGAISVGATNGSIQISSPVTSSLVGTSGISVSSNASTISVFPKALSVFDPYPVVTGSAVSSHAPASAWFSKMILDWPVAVSYANVLKSLSVSVPGITSQASSMTNKFSYSHGLTIFTRQDFAGNSSNMSQWTTCSFGMTGTFSNTSTAQSVALSWVTNSTGGTTSFSTTSNAGNWSNFFTGLQMFRIPLVTTLTPGEYFIGQQHSSTTATVGSNFTLLSVSNFHIAPQGQTVATITSSGSLSFSNQDGQGIGVASAVTTNNTMALSVISAGTQNWWYMNFSNV